MTTGVSVKEDKRFRQERDPSPSETMYERAYRAGSGATLSGMNLEEGDTLPDNASAVIVSSWIETDGKTAARLAHVVARQLHAES